MNKNKTKICSCNIISSFFFLWPRKPGICFWIFELTSFYFFKYFIIKLAKPFISSFRPSESFCFHLQSKYFRLSKSDSLHTNEPVFKVLPNDSWVGSDQSNPELNSRSFFLQKFNFRLFYTKCVNWVQLVMWKII